MESAHTTKDDTTASMPSSCSLSKAGGSDNGHNENDLHSAEITGGGISINESSVDANGGANAADAVIDERSRGQPSDGVLKSGEKPQDKDKSSQKEHNTDSIDVGSEDEGVHNLVGEIIQNAFSPGKPLRERIKKAPRRVMQQMVYTQLMEDRIKDLEKRLLQIENGGIAPEPSSTRSGKKNKPALGIKRMTFQEYLPTDPNAGNKTEDNVPIEHKQRHEFLGQAAYHLIDVVVSATQQPDRLGRGQSTKPPAGAIGLTNPSLTSSTQDLTMGDGQFVQPERIRINSGILLNALEKITGVTFSRCQREPFGKGQLLSQVILRPFKLFVAYEREIRDEVTRLEKTHMPDIDESKGKVPEMAQSKGRDPLPQPTTDALNTISESSTLDHSNEFKDEHSQNNPTDALIDGETKDTISLESKRCLEELRVLVELLDNDLKATFDLRKQIKDGVTHSIAFQDLWHLFSLGDDIVSKTSNGEHQVYRVLNVRGGRPFLCTRSQANMEQPESMSNGRDLPKFEISGSFYQWDGKDLGACEKVLTIKWYDGQKAITSLPCYPIIYSKNAPGLKPRHFFIERGKRYVELTHTTDVVHKRYDGLTLAIGVDDLKEEVDSEVIIDQGMGLLKNNSTVPFGITLGLQPDPRETVELLDPRCKLIGCCQNVPVHRDGVIDGQRSAELLENKSFMRDFIDFDSKLTELDYLVCPDRVWGYVLRSRKWVLLDISIIKDINERGSGFDSLVLPQGHKETLLALVQMHSKRKKLEIGPKTESQQMDLVRGKGKGLIILLHGEPGVGKSSTAESVAEYTRRPLFQVTCGDIGDSADEVEKRLENHFQLAHKWGCVMLLDEADVFLEARSKTDLKRNAIVSVFLRVLEYYSGILFLTTNRVGAFDQAFRSRIHMSLFYPKIEEDATIKIWEMNIARAREIWGDKLSLEEKDRKEILKFALKHYKELVKSENTWNGRQIRNAFQTAIALAEWDAYQAQVKYKVPTLPTPRLEHEHFERVAKASKHFDAYLKETLVGSAADLAREHRERKDDFRGVDV